MLDGFFLLLFWCFIIGFHNEYPGPPCGKSILRCRVKFWRKERGSNRGEKCLEGDRVSFGVRGGMPEHF